jgi:hypothetical protein
VSLLRFDGSAAEKAVVLYTLFPKVLALVAPLEEELHRVFVITLKTRIKIKTRSNKN